MTVYSSKSYTNESNNYQVVCDTSVVVFEGNADEAQNYLDKNAGDLTTAYADATVVAPGEAITGEYVSNEQYPRTEEKAGKKSAFSAWKI